MPEARCPYRVIRLRGGRSGSVTELDDGRLRVGLRTPDTTWVRRLALRLGEDARVISPPELADETRATAAAALALYE